MSLVRDTIIWRYLGDMSLCSGFILEVFRSWIKKCLFSYRWQNNSSEEGLTEASGTFGQFVASSHGGLFASSLLSSPSLFHQEGKNCLLMSLCWVREADCLTDSSTWGLYMQTHFCIPLRGSFCTTEQWCSVHQWSASHPSLPSGWESLVWDYAVGCGYFLYMVEIILW